MDQETQALPVIELTAATPLPRPTPSPTVTPGSPRISRPAAVDNLEATQIRPELSAAARSAAHRTPVGATPSPSAAKPLAREMEHLAGHTLGGYVVHKLLGAGGMGAVFLARQVSLDRDVALKVLPDRFASNAEALARFTREALSAAELNHPNIVQVYDVGAAQGHHFICMEYVRGETLAALVRRDGPPRIEDAVGYILQAARGLKYAHDRNIVHRDIKPDNLMLNDQGVIKIADMGLAKRIGMAEAAPAGLIVGDSDHHQFRGDLTQARHGLGTPAYMAPEQARDALRVDARADQYSLGCTLYYLCAGKAPYSGGSVQEILAKHLREPVVPLDKVVPGIAPELVRIAGRMLAKAPEERYPTMQHVVADLERFLGLEASKGAYKPGERHVAALDAAHAAFYAAPAARLRTLAVRGSAVLTLLLFAAALATGRFSAAGALAGLAILAAVAGFVANGVATRDSLLLRLRSLFFGMPLAGWAKTLGGAAFAVGVLYVTGQLVWWAGAAVAAVGLALGYQAAVARPLRRQRQGPLDDFLKVLRELRLRGLSEQAIEGFVCRFAKRDWEEFFEALFGYDALTATRARYAGSSVMANRSRFAAWRDPLARWIEAVELARRTAREQAAVAEVEERRLRATGLSAKEAQRRAEEAAQVFAMELHRRRQDIVARAARGEAIVPPGTPVPAAADAPASATAKAKARGPKKELAVDTDYVPESERRRVRLSARDIFWRIVRAGIGVLVLLAATSADRPAGVAEWGTGDIADYGMAAGAAVVLSAFSGRKPAAVASIAGAAIVLFCNDICAAAGLAEYFAYVFWAGVALAAAGLTPIVDLVLGGRKQ